MKKYIRSARIDREKEVYVTQEYTGYGKTGWEDIAVYDDTSSQTYKEAKEEVKSYIDNGFNARVITRRVSNSDYVEPEHTITSEEVINYLKNDCPYPISGNERGYWSGCTLGSYPKWCQIFIMDDNTVGVYNCSSRRTKYVYNLEDMINAINRIMK